MKKQSKQNFVSKFVGVLSKGVAKKAPIQKDGEQQVAPKKSLLPSFWQKRKKQANDKRDSQPFDIICNREVESNQHEEIKDQMPFQTALEERLNSQDEFSFQFE